MSLLVTTVKPIVLKWGKQLLDRSNQKMQSQLHFEALSPPMADIDSHAQLIPHLRIPEWAIQRHLNSLLWAQKGASQCSKIAKNVAFKFFKIGIFDQFWSY